LNAIAVVDENWGLGLDGKLLAHLPGDLKHFKEKTIGNTIIIGRVTYESMAGLLPGRETVILSGDVNFKANCRVVHSLEEALEYCKSKLGAGIFIAGGEAVYKLFYPYTDHFFITKLYAAFKADRYFPNLDEEPDLTVRELSGPIEENGIRYQFFKYTRVK